MAAATRCASRSTTSSTSRAPRSPREHVGDPAADPLAAAADPPRARVPLGAPRDDARAPRAGIYRDLWVSIAVPIVLAQSDEIDLAGRRRPHHPRRPSPTASCRRPGSTPRNPSTPPTGNVVFRGVNRSGVPRAARRHRLRGDEPGARRHPADLEARRRVSALSVGRVMQFDAVAPSSQTGVSTGVHTLRLWTLDRSPAALLRGAGSRPATSCRLANRSASLFCRPRVRRDQRRCEPDREPPNFGIATHALRRSGLAPPAHRRARQPDRPAPPRGPRLQRECGRCFALAGDRRLAGPLSDRRRSGDPRGPRSSAHPRRVETSRTTSRRRRGSRLPRPDRRTAIVSPRPAASPGATDHVINFAPAGVDLPTCPTGTPRCETSDNGVVNPGTQVGQPAARPQDRSRRPPLSRRRGPHVFARSRGPS